jgi:signal transduction histidine kinase
MFKLLRFYAIASLVGMLLAVAAITLFYRGIIEQSIVELAEKNNQVLAQTTLNALKPDLTEFLASMSEQRADAVMPHTTPALAASINGLLLDDAIAKIKIYNRWGQVVYSTDPHQIGERLPTSPGFAAAIHGRVKSELLYRDSFNRFDEETETDNLIQTYIPIRASPGTPIIGVFEIYTDVDALVKHNQQSMFFIIAGISLILALLYIGLLLAVRHASRIIQTQQRTIEERSKILEALSAQLFQSEERDKQKLAYQLHEGLAQTLSAIKLNVESGYPGVAANDVRRRGSRAVHEMVPVLQHAIQEVRTLATNLHPASLDDLGLLPTLNWFAREFEKQHPTIHVEQQFSLSTQKLSGALEIALYRVIESALNSIAQFADTDRVLIALWHTEGVLTLIIDDTPSGTYDVSAVTLMDNDPYLHSQLATIRERTLLSGGTFSAARNSAGGIVLRATWRC